MIDYNGLIRQGKAVAIADTKDTVFVYLKQPQPNLTPGFACGFSTFIAAAMPLFKGCIPLQRSLIDEELIRGRHIQIGQHYQDKATKKQGIAIAIGPADVTLRSEVGGIFHAEHNNLESSTK